VETYREGRDVHDGSKRRVRRHGLEKRREAIVKLENRKEQTQILVASADSDLVDTLYSEAKRKASNVDKAIAYIIRSGS
jgi:hypothetical protein